MGFKEDMQKLSAQIAERKNHVVNEEMGKQVLVMPFIQALGFDVFNPLEVRPEYIADFGKKKGEKVDYAIFKDGTPVMFIEAKSVTENLENHDAQLARYFNATPEVRIAVLTNGVVYKFFTDLNSNNIMDQSPFLTLDITNLTTSDIEILANFRKDRFETESLVRYAEELIYTSNLNAKLKDLFKNPPDDFIRFLIRDFSDTRVTSNVIERFRPIVKKSISHAILEIVSQGLFPQEVASNEEVAQTSDQVEEKTTEDKEPEETDAGRKIITSEKERASFDLIKSILEKHGLDTSSLNSKDTVNYYGIFTKNIFHWFIRLNLDSANEHIITRLPLETAQSLAPGFKVEPAPKGIGESRVYINSYHDLVKLEELIVTAFKAVMPEQSKETQP
ncbi:MAG: type I restriction enzyme HsdR N-terminal domain-containing protein [Clostridia bacterium]|nr:type I restriction enzyme HsdR N-terminal domain-containing protein [Clostridia bacterium]